MTDTKTLRELALAATPGPWSTVGMSYYHYQIHGKGINGHDSERICMTTNAVSNDAPAERREANAAYIAAASPDVVLEVLTQLDVMRVALADADIERDADRAAMRVALNGLVNHGAAYIRHSDDYEFAINALRARLGDV